MRAPISIYELPLYRQLELIDANIKVCEENDAIILVRRLKRRKRTVEKAMAKEHGKAKVSFVCDSSNDWRLPGHSEG